MLFEIFEEKFTNVNGGERKAGRHGGRPLRYLFGALFLFHSAPVSALETPLALRATSPKRGSASRQGFYIGAVVAPHHLGSPTRGAGTALAVTEGSPGLKECQCGKEKSM